LKSLQLYKKTIPNGSADKFNLIYRPYYLLDPSTPSINKQQFQDKIMSRERQNITYTRIKQIGRAYGIFFNFFEGELGGTREVHRLIHLAQTRKSVSVRDEIVEGVSRAYHENAMNISDWKALRQIAIDAGVGVEEVDEWSDMDADVGGQKLDREVERVKQVVTGSDGGQRGVPVIIIQGKYRIDGAPDVGELLDIFGKIRNGENVEGEGNGFMCGIGSDKC
jgi:predicted DsbA family dithiol-disulfide isomerase